MERVWSTSHRGFSVRSILTFVLAVFITALLWVTFGSYTQTHAADPTASWKGNNILYNGHEYFAQGQTKDGDGTGLQAGTPYYLYTPNETRPAGTTPTTAPTSQKAYVIYFASGTDPPKEKAATLVTYDYSSTNKLSNQRDKQSITVTLKGDEDKIYSSCTIQGVGWIICPITNFLAEGMDNIFDFVKTMLVVPPASTANTNSDLYTAWNIMRSIANIAFIIVFLIIIYSQVTSMGVSNYGLKKLLPRLIIAAVLVNVSYIISAIAVDLSNILGYSLQDIFNTIRQNTFNINNDTWADADSIGWSAVATFVLSGGAATIGIIAATGGSAAAAIYLLIPILLGAMVTILVVLLILAARQAIIVILIVISPLAFVAYLLPNTEQWFKKWRDLFMTMLIFFPAFSLVFGGSQLAGGLIIQNATTIIGVIFGLAVQIAPLVITPLLLKLSGGLLGRIAGLVNNPSKGLLDRSKNWSGKRAEMHRQRGVGGDLKKRNVFRRSARRLALADDRVERETNRYKAGFESYAAQQAVTSRKGQKTEVETALSKLQTEEYHKDFEQAMNELRAGDSSGLRRLQTKGSYTTTETLRMTRVFGNKTEDDIIAQREERIDKSSSFAKYALQAAHRSVELDQGSRITARATAAAQGIQQDKFAEALMASETLQRRAGGIDPSGADSALATAINTVRESYNKSVSEARAINKHFNLSSEQRQKHALGQDLGGPVDDGKGNLRTFSASSIFTREAAIEDQMATGTVDQINAIVSASGANLQSFKTTIAEAVAKNGLGAKTLYLGGKTIDDIAQGRITDMEGLMRVALETVAKGKISEKDIANTDADAVKFLSEVTARANDGRGPTMTNPTLASALPSRIVEFSEVARHTLTGDERVNVKPNSKEHILNIARLTDPGFEAAPIVPPAGSPPGTPAPVPPAPGLPGAPGAPTSTN